MADELAERVARLARLVAEARELKVVDSWFHSALVPHPAFLAESEPAVHRPLVTISRSVARSYGCAVELRDSLRRIARFSLWHGALVGEDGAMALLVYFDDQHRGVCSFGNLRDPTTHYVRFSLPEEARDPELDLGDATLVSVSSARQRGTA